MRLTVRLLSDNALISKGLNEFIAPRLRGLLALHFAAAAAGAMVIVDTVVLIRVNPGLGESEVAITLGLFGADSNACRLCLAGTT